LFAPIGPWQWGESVRGSALSSVRVSLLLTGSSFNVPKPFGKDSLQAIKDLSEIVKNGILM